MVQSPAQPAMLCTKFASSLAPSGVCTTSGWNCTPNMRPLSWAMAAKGEPSDTATGRKPSGARMILSPWLIHT